MVVPVEFYKSAEVHIQNHISAQKEKIFCKLRHFEQGSRRSQGRILHKIADMDPQAGPVPEIIPDYMAQIPHHQNDIREPAGFQVLYLPFQDGFPADGNHGFGDFAVHRGNAGAPSPRHYNGLHSPKNLSSSIRHRQ